MTVFEIWKHSFTEYNYLFIIIAQNESEALSLAKNYDPRVDLNDSYCSEITCLQSTINYNKVVSAEVWLYVK